MQKSNNLKTITSVINSNFFDNRLSYYNIKNQKFGLLLPFDRYATNIKIDSAFHLLRVTYPSVHYQL